MKANVCQIAINQLADITFANKGQKDATTNSCGIIVAQVFQSYSWYL